MNDKQIIQMYWQRNENAITETLKIYGNLCKNTASRILSTPEDIDECINDALLQVWNSIPPTKPLNFAAFIATITRNTALNKYNHIKRQKRSSNQVQLIYDEISDCIHTSEDIESEVNARMLTDALDKFLDTLSDDAQTIFVQRYVLMLSISEIAKLYNYTESKVKVTLLRTRKNLRKYLKQEGWI
ncbi:MAG: sigma-70 family RNA polymerase sigma factor [Oscillospiraceae bacterium]|nr:sigma-70 family RNA polymerase sigma factor [Oscillospiraceae bacterium]